jgi:hypothetical protein
MSIHIENAVLLRKLTEIATFFANIRWAIVPSLLLADGGYLGISQRFSYTF